MILRKQIKKPPKHYWLFPIKVRTTNGWVRFSGHRKIENTAAHFLCWPPVVVKWHLSPFHLAVLVQIYRTNTRVYDIVCPTPQQWIIPPQIGGIELEQFATRTTNPTQKIRRRFTMYINRWILAGNTFSLLYSYDSLEPTAVPRGTLGPGGERKL